MGGLTRRSILLFLAGALLGGAAAWLIWRPTGIDASEAAAAPARSLEPLTPAPAPIVGAQAPDFELAALGGSTVRLSELAGTPVVINFWATWCEPCRAELPLLDEAAGNHRGQLRVLAVESAEPEADVLSFLQEVMLENLTLLRDDAGSVRDRYMVLGYPTTLFVDSTGIVRVRKVGTYDASALADSLRLLGVTP